MFRSPFRAGLCLALAATFAVASPPRANAQKLVLRANLDEAQEVPPTGSAGTGKAIVVIDRDKNTVNYSINFSGLGSAETLAHIHGFAAPGANAPVLFNLPLGSPKIGTWNYAEADEASNDVRQHPHGDLRRRRDPRPAHARHDADGGSLR